MKKTVLVLPGAVWQVPIVKKLKKIGFNVLSINPSENSATFPYVDGYLQEDIFNEEAVLKYCKKNHVDAIISEECDIAMPLISKYGKKLGLSVLSEEAAHLFTDKFAMREHCKKIGVPYPEFCLCHNINEAVDFYKSLNTKLIMKPLDSNSSRGVFIIENEKDILSFFEESIKFSRICNAVLLERYIEGKEFTIDGIKTPNKHYSIAISEKKHFSHNKNIAEELYFTHSNDVYDYELLKEVNDKFIDNSCLEFGLTHAEYKYENGVYYLIEVGSRGGGNRISSDIVPFMTGIDNYKYLIECSLGKIENIDFTVNEKYKCRAAVLKFFETPGEGGFVKKIEGEDFLKKNENIAAYEFNFKPGDYIENAKNDAARVGYYIACCETKKDLDKLMKSINDKFRIILE